MRATGMAKANSLTLAMPLSSSANPSGHSIILEQDHLDHPHSHHHHHQNLHHQHPHHQHQQISHERASSVHRAMSVSPQPYTHSPSPLSHHSHLPPPTAASSANSASNLPPPSGSAELSSGGEGEGGNDSQFGKTKKAKRKAAPRTSRACLACRRQKMRCEGADDPPCRRCVANEVDCMFERRSDYLLNPEDRAWQNGVEKRLEQLGRAVEQILAQLGGGVPAASYHQMPHFAGPQTAGASFGEMSASGFYDTPSAMHGQMAHHHAGPGGPQGLQGGMMMPPNTAPVGSEMAPRVNYVVPTAAETAAIAAQSRFKRPRGSTMPSTVSGGPSAYTPATAHEGTFQLFSPRTAAMDSASHSLPTPYSFGAPQSSASSSSHQAPYSQQHAHESSSGSSYNYEPTGMDLGDGSNNHHGGAGAAAAAAAAGSHDGSSLTPNPHGTTTSSSAPGRGEEGAIPRSLHSPSVRFAPPPVPILHAAPAGAMSQAQETSA